MSKILILGDIHGRSCWKDIIKKENPDKVIFLGDYVSSHDNISSDEQIQNLTDILDYKSENTDKVILLRGNHDMQHLGYSWAECSGLNRQVLNWMSSWENKKRFEENTQWIYIIDDIIFSHAGISSEWIKQSGLELENINNINSDERFAFTPDSFYDMCGESCTQPCTWIRPGTLIHYPYGNYHQIVGHTPIDINICFKQGKHKMPVQMDNNKYLYLCDMLPNGWLVMEGNNLIYKV